ncbi:hypothetical protein Ae168Ps1_3308c [Pseudonocardia sp. Ae168_Ps1]|uniref:hypothetical protein n=1 Tax=unclassified Pseudonocardia TaxID=2619320 RepID=UPI00094B035F|nr:MULTISPECIES: hypothetical protein [unclassified Pseudonocardia]OLL74911.1 hypothetical protein Ae150APs1_3289c [Pseudonocardia sp. Ae150A_Ps1]OLL80902.1 hypothetical protein Ae168Ps1_3308c [Pseudonocardia sp. Ae168_Ps1]OLL84979.1 hypothetical protein Ae263Ps1_2034 [Pseudonocardia sp. Ae263_Ps1]OLL95004.1 hypothetical protein Ae356Ps1_4901c [Pseudonocardia sp. Ae356_Ps1]
MAINLGARDRVRTLPKVNRRALRRYGEFWRALQLVGDALAEAEKVAAKTTDAGKGKRAGKGVSAKTGGQHWSTASPDEVSASAKKAHGSLRVMASSAKRWEAELVSREWRK